MTTAGIFLLVLWTGAHMLILTVVQGTRQTRTILLTISLMIMLVYVIKPYTYDLNKYSIFFHTGYIPVYAWHSPNGEFRLDPRDATGEPFEGGFEVGFTWLAKMGSKAFPAGSLVPRFDADHGDFRERGPPRSDAMIYLIMGLGFMVLLVGVRSFGIRSDVRSYFSVADLFLTTPIILGSVFFVLGSQNSLRQFLGLAIVMLAMSSMISRHYFVSAGLVVLSGAFHHWAPILGLVGIYLVMLGNISNKKHVRGEEHPLWLSQPEVLSLLSGVVLVVLIKLIMMTGGFNWDIPLIDNLKPYVLRVNEFNVVNSLGKINVLLKASMIFGLVLISESLIGKTKRNQLATTGIRSLRRRTILLILPLAVYPEIFSRVLVLYWAVEIVFLAWALNSEIARVRLGGIAVFVAYGFAPNAVNILVGPNWLSSF